MQISSGVNRNMSNFMFLWWSIKNNLIKKQKKELEKKNNEMNV